MISETSKVESLVADVLQRRFAHEDFVGSEVELGESFEGDQFIRVTAHFRRQANSAHALFAASDEIRNRLLEIGDPRYVLIRQHIDEGNQEEFVDEDDGRQAR